MSKVVEADLIKRTVERRNMILLSGKEKADQILKEAKREAKRIKEEAERRVREMINRQLKALRDRIIGEAENEGRRKLMMEREKLINMVFEKVNDELRKLAESASDEYKSLLKRLVDEAVNAIGGSKFVVLVNERDVDLMREIVKTIEKERRKEDKEFSIKLSSRRIKGIGGVVVESEDGSKIYNNTLEGRLLRARNMLRAEVGKILGVV